MQVVQAGQRPPAWTPEEDAKFVSILETEILENGKTLEEVYPIVAETLGRPEGGCKYRYTSAIRKTLTGKLKEKLVDNSPKANSRQQVLNTKAVQTRSNIITRIQQVDKDLVKIEKDIAEAERKLAELKQRKIDLGNDMVRYTDMLVKSAKGEESDHE